MVIVEIIQSAYWVYLVEYTRGSFLQKIKTLGNIDGGKLMWETKWRWSKAELKVAECELSLCGARIVSKQDQRGFLEMNYEVVW